MARRRIGDLVIGLLEAAPGLVHEPPVVVAADTSFLDEPERKIGAPVRALPVDETEGAAAIAIEDEVFAEQADRLDRQCIELAGAGNRHPVPPQEVAHWRTRSYTSQQLVQFLTQHAVLT